MFAKTIIKKKNKQKKGEKRKETKYTAVEEVAEQQQTEVCHCLCRTNEESSNRL